MKKILSITILLLLTFLVGCTKEPSSPTPPPIVEEDKDTEEAKIVVLTNSEEASVSVIDVSDIWLYGSSATPVEAKYFDWGDYLPVVKYANQYSVLDYNMSKVDEGKALYEKMEKKQLFETLNIPPYSPHESVVYITPSGKVTKKTFNNGIVDYSDSSGVYTAKIYTLDEKHIATLQFPYHDVFIDITTANSFTTYKKVSCKVEQIVNEDVLLLNFTVKIYDARHDLERTNTVAYLYNIQTKEKTLLNAGVLNPRVTPDCKYLIYAGREDEVNEKLRTYKEYSSRTFYVEDIEKNIKSEFTLGFEYIGKLSVMCWVNKDRLYNELGEKPPKKENELIFLEAENENAEVIDVTVPVSALTNEFIFEKGVSASKFDFGNYVPFFEKSYTYGDTGAIMNDYAFFANSTENLEDAENLYRSFNSTFDNDPILVDERGNEVKEHPLMEAKVYDISPDFSKISQKQSLYKYEQYAYPTFNSGLNLYWFWYGNSRYYIDGKLARPTPPEKTANNSYKRYHTTDNTIYLLNDVTPLYADEDVLVYQKNGSLLFYSIKTNELIKAVNFKRDEPSNYDSVDVGEEYVGGMDIISSEGKKLVLIIVGRDIRHADGDCTCGMRGHTNNALFSYNLKTNQIKLLANNFVSYSISPDEKYVAYTYNNVESIIETVDEDNEYYDVFEGGIYIKNIESGEFVSYPYYIKNRSHDDTPTAAWKSLEWLEKDKFEKALEEWGKKEKETEQIHLIPSPDEKTVEIELDIPDNLNAVTNKFVSSTNFSFGDYLPMIKYPDVEYISFDHNFDTFSILNNDTKTIEDGNLLYKKFNDKFKDSYKALEEVKEQYAPYLFESRVIYISEDADTVSTFALKGGEKTFKDDDFTQRLWGSTYKIFKGGSLSYTEDKDFVDYRRYSLGEYYNRANTREFTYVLDESADIMMLDGEYLADDIYRDENVRIYRSQDTLLIYSVKEDRITHKLNLSKELANYEYRFIEQVVGGRYLVLRFKATLDTYSTRDYHNIFLYDMETGECELIAHNMLNPLVSPDLKYIIGTSNLRSDDCEFYVINLETNDTAVFSYTCSSGSNNHSSYETVNWINKDKFIESIE